MFPQLFYHNGTHRRYLNPRPRSWQAWTPLLHTTHLLFPISHTEKLGKTNICRVTGQIRQPPRRTLHTPTVSEHTAAEKTVPPDSNVNQHSLKPTTHTRYKNGFNNLPLKQPNTNEYSCVAPYFRLISLNITSPSEVELRRQCFQGQKRRKKVKCKIKQSVVRTCIPHLSAPPGQ